MDNVSSTASIFNFTGHNVLCAIPRIDANGETSFVVMPYTKDGWTSIRHPAETSENGETVRETVIDGVNSEVAKDPRKGLSKIEFSSQPVWWKINQDEHHPGGLHLKPVVIVMVEGELRDDREQWDGNELHGKVELVEVEQLLKRRMVKGASVLFHVDATYEVIMHLASIHPAVNARYQHLLAEAEVRRERRPAINQAEKDAVYAYCARERHRA